MYMFAKNAHTYTMPYKVQSLLELLIGTRESKDSRVQAGLAIPSPAFKGLVDKLGLILKLGRSSIGLASPRVPASPMEASPRVR